ncbi:hypothetical protein Ntsu_49260 [Nocardia sp. IFM 10818]
MVQHRGEGGGEARPVDALGQGEHQLLGESGEGSAAREVSCQHRWQRNLADAAAGQFDQARHRFGPCHRDTRQPGHGAMLENILGGEHDSRRARTRHQLNGQNAVPARGEERIVRADPHPEDLVEQFGEPGLHRTFRRP